ncbi:hypothetical protein AmDm5_3139 [Acetobacter malorum]|uniref:hypothetical protein n=1 Tax=Acetobacter persici TaxID=1076596 RepID=UPI00050182D9|nr:hypothetical protein [Acetobacter persici]KFL87384.1 hypothetical protein AmDm5_3139 [Acetobacter malorum]MCG0998946.1 hypothetical protein [Acetobacter persici]
MNTNVTVIGADTEDRVDDVSFGRALCRGIMVGVATPISLLIGAPAFAQTQINVAPTSPLQSLKTARSNAESSNMDITHVQTTGNNMSSLIMIVAVVIGLGLALTSGIKLYKNVQDGDNARGSNMAYILGLIIGSLITIICFIVGVVTIYATGNN